MIAPQKVARLAQLAVFVLLCLAVGISTLWEAAGDAAGGEVVAAAGKALFGLVFVGAACWQALRMHVLWRLPDAAFVDRRPKYTAGEKARGLIGLWVLTAFFLVISVPWAATIVYRAATQSEWIPLLELFFLPIPAFALLAYAIVLTRRRKRGPSPTTHGSRASLG